MSIWQTYQQCYFFHIYLRSAVVDTVAFPDAAVVVVVFDAVVVVVVVVDGVVINRFYRWRSLRLLIHVFVRKKEKKDTAYKKKQRKE